MTVRCVCSAPSPGALPGTGGHLGSLLARIMVLCPAPGPQRCHRAPSQPGGTPAAPRRRGQVGLSAVRCPREKLCVTPAQVLLGRRGGRSQWGQMLLVSLCLPSGGRVGRCLLPESPKQAALCLAGAQLLAREAGGSASSSLSSLSEFPLLLEGQSRVRAGRSPKTRESRFLAQAPDRAAGSGPKNHRLCAEQASLGSVNGLPSARARGDG